MPMLSGLMGGGGAAAGAGAAGGGGGMAALAGGGGGGMGALAGKGGGGGDLGKQISGIVSNPGLQTLSPIAAPAAIGGGVHADPTAASGPGPEPAAVPSMAAAPGPAVAGPAPTSPTAVAGPTDGFRPTSGQPGVLYNAPNGLHNLLGGFSAPAPVQQIGGQGGSTGLF